jgi:hypothetical protein
MPTLRSPAPPTTTTTTTPLPFLLLLLLLLAPAIARAHEHPAAHFVLRSAAVLDESAANNDDAWAALARRAQDLQTFGGALGGIGAGGITPSGDSERPFQAGGETFVSGSFVSVGFCLWTGEDVRWMAGWPGTGAGEGRVGGMRLMRARR